jgi:hypothetical protein
VAYSFFEDHIPGLDDGLGCRVVELVSAAAIVPDEDVLD